MLREYQEQFRKTQQDIEVQAQQQEQELQYQAESARESMRKQALGAITEVRGGISEVEVEHQDIAQALREAERAEERRKSISTYTPTDLHTEERLKELEKSAESVFAGARRSREDIERQEAEALASIDAALNKALGELGTEKQRTIEDARRQYEKASEAFEAANIELGDGQWIDKKQWDAYFADMPLETKQNLQAIAKTQGLEAMNKAVEELSITTPTYISTEIPPENSVKLMTGEYVDKDKFEALPLIDQNTLRIQGVDAYNTMIATRAATEIIEPPEGIEVVEQTIEVVELDTPTGKIQMPKEDWYKLSDTEQMEIHYGRPPTLAEYQAHKLDKDLIKTGKLMSYDVDSYFRSQPYSTGLGQLTELIPGTQKYELINNVMAYSEKEWKDKYPDLAQKGVIATSLTYVGLPVAKTMYPDIETKDVTIGEWVQSGISAATLLMAFWLPKLARIGTRTPASVIKITPKAIRTEFQKTYLAASEAGAKNTAMNIAIKRLDPIKATPKAKATAQLAIQDSIKADTTFVKRFAGLDKVNIKDVGVFEKASGMTGLKKATVNLVKTRQAFEASLKKAGTEALIADPKARVNLETTRAAFYKAIDDFTLVTQPRSNFWRVPPPDTLEQAGFTVKPKPVNPTMQKLFDSINDYAMEHPQIAPESRGGVAVAIKPAKVKPAMEWDIAPKTRVVEGEAPVTDPLDIKIKGFEVDVAPVAKPTPAPVTKPSVFPGIVAPPKGKEAYQPSVETERLGAMTPEQAQRLSGETQTIDAISPYIIETIGEPMRVLSPNIQTRVINITRAAADYAIQIKPLTITNTELSNKVSQFIQNQLEAITDTTTRAQVEPLTSTMTNTALELSTKMATLTTTPVTTTTIIPPPIPDGQPAVKGITHRPVNGTAVWKMGEPRGFEDGMWYAVPPPYTTRYAIKGRPLGLTKPDAEGEGSAYRTFEVVGGTGAIIQDADIDIGVTIVHLRKGEGIDFSQDKQDAYKGKGRATIRPVALPRIQPVVDTEAEFRETELEPVRIRKPRNMKDWWDSDFYDNEPVSIKPKAKKEPFVNTGGRLSISRIKKSGRLMIHELLPSDLGGEGL